MAADDPEQTNGWMWVLNKLNTNKSINRYMAYIDYIIESRADTAKYFYPCIDEIDYDIYQTTYHEDVNSLTVNDAIRFSDASEQFVCSPLHGLA